MQAVGFIIDVNRKNFPKIKQEIVKSMKSLKYGDVGYLFNPSVLEEETYPIAKIVSLMQKYAYEKFVLWEGVAFVSLVLSKDTSYHNKIIAITDSEIKFFEKPIELVSKLNLEVELNFISVNPLVARDCVKTIDIKELSETIEQILETEKNGNDRQNT